MSAIAEAYHEEVGIMKLRPQNLHTTCTIRWMEQPANRQIIAGAVRDSVAKGVKLLNRTANKLDLPYVFHDFARKESDFALTSGNGNLGIAEQIRQGKGLLFLTPSNVGNLLRTIVAMRTHRFLQKDSDLRLITAHKDTQGGKTWDMFLVSLFATSAFMLEFNRFVVPLILLPGKIADETQTKSEYPLNSDLSELVGISMKRGGEIVRIRDISRRIANRYDDCGGTHVMRRTKGTLEKIAALCRTTVIDHDEDFHFYVDECDQGCGQNSILDQIYSRMIDHRSIYEFMQTPGEKRIMCLNVSATPFPHLKLKDTSIAVKWEEEPTHINWMKHPILTHRKFSELSGVPEWDLLAETVAAGYHPFAARDDDDEVTQEARAVCFLKNNMIPVEKDGKVVDYRLREPFEPRFVYRRKHILHFLDHFGVGVLQDLMEKWKEMLPSVIDRGVRAALLSDGSVREFDNKRGMVLRFVLHNDMSHALIDEIEVLSGGDYFVIPITSARMDKESDVISHINSYYAKAKLTFKDKPFLAIVTNHLRRGSRLCDDIIQVEFARKPTTLTALMQQNGRSSNKKNALLVVTDAHYKAIKAIKEGRSTMPTSKHLRGFGRGRPSKTVFLRRDAIDDPRLLRAYQEVDDTILNVAAYQEIMAASVAKKQKRGNGLTGGVSLVSSGRPLVPSLFSIFTPALLDLIEKNHEQLFKNPDGTPKYSSLSLLKFNPAGGDDEQPMGLPSTKDETIRERYQCVQVNGKSYFLHGYRWDADRTNTGARRQPWLQQPQIEFIYDKRTRRLRCTELHLRMATTPKRNERIIPTPGTVPFNHGSVEERLSWGLESFVVEAFKEKPQTIARVRNYVRSAMKIPSGTIKDGDLDERVHDQIRLLSRRHLLEKVKGTNSWKLPAKEEAK